MPSFLISDLPIQVAQNTDEKQEINQKPKPESL
jgi:hypothetical protein